DHIAPAIPGFGEGNADQDRTGRIETVRPHDFRIAIGMKPDGTNSTGKIDWPFTARHGDTEAAPGSPRQPPAPQGGGGDTKVPPGRFVVRVHQCGEAVIAEGWLPSALPLE